uniref:NADH-ubiquinone oxidoreductase chain 4 n=1 Tax=Trouessartia rubecula TaxID=474308 RepID=A0A410HYG5_9ACAR|nr:NADH dehydrogenase subunit 4 [Trouessartia rubecula]QAB47273.1 NADH dehydrogenase subunit 4 [Trouessartia rubecula]
MLSIFLLLGSFFIFFDWIYFLWFVPSVLFLLLVDNLSSFFSMTLVNGLFLMDYVSLLMIFITFWIFLFCVYCVSNFYSFCFMWVMFLFLVLCFLVDSYLLFYLLFEFVFLLMFVFLLSWGKTMERVQASFYMFFFTLVFSLPFLVFILYFIENYGVFSFLSIYISFSSFGYGYDWLCFFLMVVFLVKLPLYMVHMWLPKAHVEAPVSGSMLLAGVLLKLGGYGIYRFFPVLISFSLKDLFNFLFYVSLFGGAMMALICLRQSDLKVIIAYSSVVHMSFMVVGILSFTDSGKYGFLLMLVAHGFVSSFLFFGLNYIYEVFHSRSIFVLKGLIVLSSFFVFFWFLGVILNLGFPPFMSFFSEVFIVSGFSSYMGIDWLLVLLFFLFCGFYNIFLYVIPSHGESFSKNSFSISFSYSFFMMIHFFFVLVFPLLSL